MNAIARHTVAPHLLAELALHLRNTGSNLSVTQAASAAIRAWIAANTPQASPAPADPVRGQGYQWKSLFLLSGTELRMTTRAATYHARVEGDNIMYEGRRVSPRALTLAIAGEGRNAWRDLWLKFPGERYWKQALRCRSDLKRSMCAQAAAQAASQTTTPADTVAAAAAVMSDALKTMLELVERVSARPVHAEERRVNRARREEDILADHCAFD